jgi:hypothetical protein
LAGLFGIGVVALLLVARESPLARWTLAETLAPQRLLPIIGLGVLFGLIGIRTLAAASLLFALGIAAGLIAEDQLLRLLDAVPQAATHLFLTGPISYLAVGVALAAGRSRQPILTPIAALVFGAMFGLIVRLTDPSLHAPAYTWTPVVIAGWIILAVSFSIRAFRRNWFDIFGRILGSWLLAIGLLYGGAMLVPKRQLPAAPSPLSPNFNRTFPDSDRLRDQPRRDVLPGIGGFAPDPQPR